MPSRPGRHSFVNTNPSLSSTLIRVHRDWQLSVVLTICARTEVKGLETGEERLNGGL
jgi:hypothetical protein